MDIVFARHRQRYDSYHDFWQLVALSGFQSCYLDEVDVRSDHFYVALTPFNDELWQLAMQRNLHPDRRGRIAFWSLERPDFPGAGTTTEFVTRALQCADRVWVSDRWYQQLDPRQQHVIFGSHPNLQPLAEPRPRIFDYCHVSYVNPRRARILRTLRDAGLSEAPARGPGPERDQLLRSSAVLVNVHQTDAPVGSFLRFALAAAYRKPLVSEQLADPYPLRAHESFLQAPAAALPGVVRAISAFESEAAARALGEQLWYLLCHEHTFRSEVVRAVDQQLQELRP